MITLITEDRVRDLVAPETVAIGSVALGTWCIVRLDRLLRQGPNRRFTGVWSTSRAWMSSWASVGSSERRPPFSLRCSHPPRRRSTPSSARPAQPGLRFFALLLIWDLSYRLGIVGLVSESGPWRNRTEGDGVGSTTLAISRRIDAIAVGYATLQLALVLLLSRLGPLVALSVGYFGAVLHAVVLSIGSRRHRA